MNYFALSLLPLLTVLLAAPSWAQLERPTPDGPDIIQPNTDPLPPVEPLPPLEDLLPETTDPSIPAPEDIPGEIVVQQFQVVGNTVFSGEVLTELLEPYTNRPLSFAELLQVAETLTEAYQERGYITSGAFIPEQSMQGGVVTIQAVEGEVEAINIEGLNRLNSGYIRSRLARASRPPLNRERLLNGLQLLQLDPLVETLSVDLSAGTRPGQSILEVEATEADATRFDFTVDNQRSPSVGTMRRLSRFTHNNFLGYGDRFSVGYINTDGSNTLDGLSYTIPLNARNGTLRFTHSRGRNNIIEDPFTILDIYSDSTTYQLTYRQPLYQTVQDDLALSLTASWQQSQSFLGLDDIGPFPFNLGADNEGKTTVAALRFIQEYSHRTDNDVLALRSQFSLGLDTLGATVNEGNIPDSQFLSWRLQAQYLRLLAPDTILLLRSDFQLADRSLLAFEQFAIGGLATVRGYRQDFRSADNGMFASAELRLPVLRIPEWDTLVQVAPFVDIGQVWNTGDIELESPTRLSSVGVGLHLRVGPRFSARVDWGVPLVSVDSNTETLQEDGLYFSLEYSI
ncbi:ShlB/FhaC/HecB family hemolysin secretion/activation protein [Spirulina sp. CS-785/01]|uniref:ShlB/FhaC/HecB family hemolysin secretion/activation protein n=1 Tax=Spirulina sp. CS-785/01 TaxID=3021716 RepID=UPI00232F8258|nr:ShlB/FhaC/HecB family hemolysin secretion/activation protein [Spirulina sp. CS-785/01]MDB9314651.1 ShlB/FhaC/HecB family hemolysin secretion/activation protein [Spirulina sp. CS-785/01]